MSPTDIPYQPEFYISFEAPLLLGLVYYIDPQYKRARGLWIDAKGKLPTERVHPYDNGWLAMDDVIKASETAMLLLGLEHAKQTLLELTRDYRNFGEWQRVGQVHAGEQDGD